MLPKIPGFFQNVRGLQWMWKRSMFGVNVGMPGQPKKTTTPPPKVGGLNMSFKPSDKPMLRNLIFTQLKWQALGALIFVTIMTLNFRLTVCNCRKKHYKAFWRCYDPNSDFERMKRVGVFAAIAPDGSINPMS